MATLARRYEDSTLVTLFANICRPVVVHEIIFFIPLLTRVSVKILLHSHVCERDDTIFIRTTRPLYNIPTCSKSNSSRSSVAIFMAHLALARIIFMAHASKWQAHIVTSDSIKSLQPVCSIYLPSTYTPTHIETHTNPYLYRELLNYHRIRSPLNLKGVVHLKGLFPVCVNPI